MDKTPEKQESRRFSIAQAKARAEKVLQNAWGRAPDRVQNYARDIGPNVVVIPAAAAILIVAILARRGESHPAPAPTPAYPAWNYTDPDESEKKSLEEIGRSSQAAKTPTAEPEKTK